MPGPRHRNAGTDTVEPVREPRVETRSRRPAAPLRGLVDGYTDFLLDGVPPGVHRGLPGRHLTLVVPLDGPLETEATPEQPAGRFDVAVGGLRRTPARIRMPRRSEGVQIALTPSGCRALLGVPAGELGSWVGDLADILGPRARELHERMWSAVGPAERFGVLDAVLLGLLDDRRQAAAPEVGRAWDRLLAGAGTVAVGSLATDVGWSRRHLAGRFRREYGLPPKVAARVVRFERSVGMVRQRPRRPLVEVAVTCGYADQAHLAREWRELAGCAPSHWLAEESAYQPAPPSRSPAGASVRRLGS